MFGSRTTFVVGAGASKEFELPLGGELQDRIVKLFSQNPLPPNIRDAFAAAPDGISYNKCLEAVQEVRRGLHGAASIDRFLAMRADSALSFVSKIAIADILLLREEHSVLNADAQFSLSSTSKIWLGTLLTIMQANIKIEQPHEFFNNVSFVCFNYDRCIEQFFFRALPLLFGWNDQDTQVALRNLRIHHPYGWLGHPGFLPKQVPAAPVVKFGNERNAEALLAAAGSLYTIGDARTEETIIHTIREDLSATSAVCFLGFSFDDLNMEILGNHRKNHRPSVFGTTFGESDSNVGIFNRLIDAMYPRPPQNAYIMSTDTWRPAWDSVTAAEYLKRFGRELARQR